MDKIDLAKSKFEELILQQLERVKKMNSQADFIDFKAIPTIVIGVVPGDGIGPAITGQAARVLEASLKNEISAGKVVIKTIEGLTIERRCELKKSIPDDCLAELKECHVILKGPTTTPDVSAGMPNIESANVTMRKELDLFANVRPVKVEALGIDWTFFRENTEGAYALGSKGFDVDEDLAMDFTVTTTEGCRRIIRAAFDYAKQNGKTKVTAVTKANILKTTDGKFLKIFKQIAAEYADIETDEWYIDIMTAKLLDEKRRSGFQVLVMPNLYGDILTDEAAEIQGGVGTAGSANVGKRYAMFEAIHGSAPRMVSEGRDKYADPSSIIRAAAILLGHIGFPEKAKKIDEALSVLEKDGSARITGNSSGVTCEVFADKLISYLL